FYSSTSRDHTLLNSFTPRRSSDLWQGAVIATGVAVVSLRPLERVKERIVPQRAARRLLVELAEGATSGPVLEAVERHGDLLALRDRKSTRLNSSHDQSSYAVFCVK